MQSDQNIHQNAANCTMFSKFSCAAYMPRASSIYMSANQL